MTAQDDARATLLTRLGELASREEALGKHLRGQDGRNEADFADRVAYTEMDEVLEQLDDAARLEIEQIRGALKRMDDGTWGVCVKCGGAIQPGRLAAMPQVALCVDCAG